MDEFSDFVSLHNPILIGVTETWFSDCIDSSEVSLPGFSLFRADRIGSTGGGVAFYVRSALSPQLVYVGMSAEELVEQIWLDINIHGVSILFGLIYRSPCSIYSAWLEQLTRLAGRRRVVVMGDFNCPDINWSADSHVSRLSPISTLLLGVARSCGLSQLVREPTRLSPTGNSILDLLLVSDELLVSHVRCFPPLSTSDHCIVAANLLVSSVSTTATMKRNFWKADLDMIRIKASELSWFPTDEGVESRWKVIKSNLQGLTDVYVPLAAASVPSARPPWLTKPIRALLHRRGKAWRRFRDSGLPNDYDSYKSLRNLCKLRLRQSKKLYETALLDNCATRPKQLFAYINRKSRTPPGIPDLRDSSGHWFHDNHDKACLFAAQYSSIYSGANTSNVPSHCSHSPASDMDELSDVNFTEGDIYSLLRTINSTKSPGPDGIHPLIVKTLAAVLAPPLYSLFRMSLDTATLPLDWKTGIVRPYLKGGDTADPANYRPICMSSVVIKVLEKLVRNVLDHFLARKGFFSSAQHGFVPGRSCITNLMLSREQWCDAWGARLPVHVILIDFSKAFDRVNHRLLLDKLMALGVSGLLSNWISAYLRNRIWKVAIGDSFSGDVVAESGVPQGSVLGPRLFTVFVHDLPSVIDSNCLLYADDLKVWRVISTPRDVDILQNDLNKLSDWATGNHLPIHPQKSEALVVSRENASVCYSVMGKNIPVVSGARNLGLLVRQDLKTADHTVKARNAGLRLLWKFRRSLTHWSSGMFCTVLKTFIRPVMEYGAPVFHPITRAEMLSLEDVQRIGSRMIPRIGRWHYIDRCKYLKLFTLEYRSHRADLILLFRTIVLHQFPDLFSLFVLDTPMSRSGHPYRLAVIRPVNRPLSIADIYRWSHRVIPLWNSLPSSIVTANSLAIFKTSLDEYCISLALGDELRAGHLHHSPFGEQLTC